MGITKRRISRRLKDICTTVHIGETVADIGTDHGYVPMMLVKQCISPYVIMSDISKDSLAKSIQTFDEVGLPASEEQFRVGDGLKSIEPGEVDDIIIAGMGGCRIIKILKRDMEKTKSFKRLILQPRRHAGNLRHFLYTNGFEITQEVLSPEGKFICEIICASPTDVEKREAPYPEDDIRWNYPKSFETIDYKLLKKRLDWKFASIDEEILNLKKSSNDSSEIVERLMSDRAYLTELLEACKNNE